MESVAEVLILYERKGTREMKEEGSMQGDERAGGVEEEWDA